MVDQPPPKKVVKRVVKRSVAPRTAADQAPATPTMRYGRPVEPSAPRAASPTKVAAPDQPAPTPPAQPAVAKSRRPQITIKKPDVSLGGVRQRAARAASAVGTGTRRYSRSGADFVIDRWYDVRAWQIPTVEPIRATLLTGLLVGLLTVGLGVLSLEVFSQVRGVASGGGRWGSLTFVVLAFAAFALGERLLAAFGTPMPRLTSFLGVTLTIIVMLALLIDVADSQLGLVVVPALAAASYLAAHWLLSLAESVPPETE